MAGGFVSDAGPVNKYNGHVTIFVLFACTVAASGGLIFGYDIGITGTFWIYCGFSLFGLIFVAVGVPETRGKTLEEIEQSFK